MKYFFIVLLIIVGISLGVFIGLGGLEGIGWVAFIVAFPLMYIFGAIIYSKSKAEKEKKADKIEKDKWDRYEWFKII